MKKSLLLTLALALVLALCCAVASAECSHPSESLQTITTVEPKCGVQGAYKIVCNDCKATVATGTLEAKTHKNVEILNIPATCKDAGKIVTQCEYCGTQSETPIAKNPANHTEWGEWYEDKSFAHKCNEVGWQLRVCKGCDAKEGKVLPAGEHTWGEWIKDTANPPSCTVAGWQYRVCSVCGDAEGKEDPALGHAMGEWIVSDKPTCQKTGWQYKACTRTGCTYTEGEEIAKLTHVMSDWIVSDEATCEKDGWRYKYCTNAGCDNKGDGTPYTEGEVITKLGHDKVIGKVKDEATCTKAGAKQDYCNRCKTWLGSESAIPALGHDMQNVDIIRKALTCDTRLNYTDSKVGLIQTKCSRCKELGSKEYWLEHEVVNEVKPATCCTLGIDISYCKICGMIFHDYSTENYNLDNHDYEEYWAVVEEETCYSEGKYNVYCTGCSKLLREDTKAAVAHGTIMDNGSKTFVAGEGYSVDPTCEKVGKKVTICSKCYFSNGKVTVISEEEIPATGHNWAFYDMTKKPTCRQTGINLYVCVNGCGATYEVELPKLEGHSWTVTPITTPKCGIAGINKCECTTCGIDWYEIVDAGEHAKDAGKVTTEPTCTTEGVMTYTCTLCGETFTEKIPATGHTMGDFVIIINPTCVDNGVETSKCKNCDYSEYRDVEATGHNYVCVNTVATCEVAGKNVYTCTRCGDSYTEVIPALGHNFETVITREPTATKDGEKADICTVCGAKTNVQVVEYVEMHFGCTMTLDGIQLNNLDAEQTAWNRVAVVDTTVDGTYTFNLVVDNKWTIGTATVTVANGTLTVTYKAGALKVKSETITVYDSLDALKADEGTVVKAGEAVAVSGNTAFIALNAIVNFDAGDYRVADYAEDAELIAEMKALIA